MAATIHQRRLKFYSLLELFHVSARSIPVALLVVCLLAYGILVPSWGFYQDDWNFVYYARTGGTGALFEFMDYDGHPTTAWSYIFSFWLLGFNPTFWQIYSLILRFLAVLSFWWVVNSIWPKQKLETFMAATLFAIYPVFYLQPQAVAYFEVWISYSFIFLSIFFSLESLKQSNRFWVFTFFAILFKIAHVLTSEYTWGLEILRPALLWVVISNATQAVPATEKAKKVAFTWLPHLVIFIGIFVWRGIFYNSPDLNRSEPTFLNLLLQSPRTMIPTLITKSLQDLTLYLFSGWYRILQPSMLNISVLVNIMILLFIVVFSALFWVYLLKISDNIPISHRWIHQAFPIGVFGILCGLIPFYAAGYFIHEKIEPWNGRFALGPMPGIAIFSVVLIEFFISSRKKQYLFFAILTGLTIGWQIRSGNQFRWAWEKQRDFYYQLQLRAPFVLPGTSIISEEEFLPYMGGYPTAFALNSLYAQENKPLIGSNDPNYWFFPLSDFMNSAKDRLSGIPFSVTRAAVTFQGEPQGSILVTFRPEQGECLWIIRSEYASSKALSETTRTLAQISYVDRIQRSPQNGDSFLDKYLYTNPDQDWCYYYEKADLAYQYEDWREIIVLWETANQNGLQPENGFEYLPFIEAYAHHGDWDTAKKMTRISQKTMQGIEPLLCEVWTGMENDAPPSPEKEAALSSVKEDLKCAQE